VGGRWAQVLLLVEGRGALMCTFANQGLQAEGQVDAHPGPGGKGNPGEAVGEALGPWGLGLAVPTP
jgi:hypothetical protein